MPQTHDWSAIGHALMTGTPPSIVRRQLEIDKRTLNAAIERYRLTGSMAPARPNGGRGKVRRSARCTTAAEEKRVRNLLARHRADDLEYTTRCVKMDMARLGTPINDVSVRVLQRRANEFGYMRNDRLPAKENYTSDESGARLKLAEKGVKRPLHFWSTCVSIDEHDIIHPVGRSGTRQVASRKRWGWSKFCLDKKSQKRVDPSDRYKVVRPSSKKGNTQGGKHIKCIVACTAKHLLVCKNVQHFIDKRAPPKAKIAKLSKNGKRLGRKPDVEKQQEKAKDKKFDGAAYCEFLKELNTEVRRKLRLKPTQRVHGIADGLTSHWTRDATDLARSLNLEIERNAPRSPGLNPIENMFGNAAKELDRESLKSPPADEAETEKRFRASCARQVASGSMRRTFAALPARFQRVIDAKGKATKD